MSGSFGDEYRDRPTTLPPDAFQDEPEFQQEAQREFSVGRGHSPGAVLFAGALFLATCVTTFLVGTRLGDAESATSLNAMLRNGLSYAGPLMLILLCHEMGHYLQSRKYGIPATLPVFIPTPPGLGPFGTFGAVIVQAAGRAKRKAMFDIAISGPLAGLVAALPVAWWGVQHSRVAEIPPGETFMRFGDPLLLKAMVWMVHGELAPNQDVIINPVLFAGWVGIFLTGLNLVPVGQLDGGHVMYTLVGRQAHRIAWAVMAIGIAYMAWTQNWSYALIVLLLLLFGVRHPPTANDREPLGAGRVILGWLTMGLLLVCFTPRPLEIMGPQPAPKAVPAPQQHHRELPPPEDPDEPILNV